MRVAVNQGNLETGVIAKCPGRFVADDQSWRIIEGLLYYPKIAEIHVWNKLKSYKRPPISEQILSAIKSNEQLLTDSQCNG